MKILLLAYACEPNKGSEPGVGWNWAVEIARCGHDVFVITRLNNRVSIEHALKYLDVKRKLNFIYYDLPIFIKNLKKGRRFHRLYYFFWQLAISKLVDKYHSKENFDVVHHLTFAGFLQPIFMAKQKIPYIVGPLGGGEHVPLKLTCSTGFYNTFIECLRWLSRYLIYLSPRKLKALKEATIILVTSMQTRDLVPKKFLYKTDIKLAIGINSPSILRCKFNSKKTNFLYVGRILYWKGIDLALKAFTKYLEYNPSSFFTIVGEGSDLNRIRKLIKYLKIEDNVNILPWVNQFNLESIYASNNTFLFPSHHDSGGMVILEAMAKGLPVICLDIGGPGIMVDRHSGVKINVKSGDANTIILNIVKAMKKINHSRSIWTRYSNAAFERSQNFSWSDAVSEVYGKNSHYQKILNNLINNNRQ